MGSLELKTLGLINYDDAWALQKKRVAHLQENGNASDILLLLEHPPTYTLGRRGSLDNLLLDQQTLDKEGFALRWVDRGGDITYHGPGQLVGYPLLNLKRLFANRGYTRPDLHQYLRDIEEMLIKTLAHFGIRGWRYEGYTGVWVDGPQAPEKIAAIGIKVSARGISSHGFALNINPNLDHFENIIPCGIEAYGVTSMSRLTHKSYTLPDVIPVLVQSFSEIFDLQPSSQSQAQSYDLNKT